ncbi:MAG: hypothetical protein PHH16_04080 [Candidatus Gracilibacteria bacterium]|nr:hypothetical protein [Candidatus Gracilibacteria bacterium]
MKFAGKSMFLILSQITDSPGFEKHAKYVLDLCHEFGIPEFDLDYDIDSLNEYSDIEGISEEILAGYYAARALGIGVFGYWIVPYENIIKKNKKVPEFCQNYTGESVCITPKGEFKLCGYEPVSIGKFPNIKVALESDVYSQKILLNETSIDTTCTGCELEGVCAGQCPISPRKTASWEAGCNLYRVITKKLLQNHLDPIPGKGDFFGSINRSVFSFTNSTFSIYSPTLYYFIIFSPGNHSFLRPRKIG